MDTSSYEHIINPRKKLLDLDLKGLWQYRDLYVMYIKRDIVTYYKQTIFGPLWYVIQPILTTVMYMFVFGGLAKIPTDGIPQPLFYMAGITLWNYFSQTFTACSNVFANNASVFGKVYFPRLVVPLASCSSNLIRLVIQFVLFMAIYIYYVVAEGLSFSMTVAFLLCPLVVIVTGLMAMAAGLFFSSWTVKYRDLQYVVQFGVQLVMYATPVIYPLSFAPESYRWLMNLNPLTPLFEMFKYGCLGVGTFSMGSIVYSLGFTLVMLFVAVLVFNRTEQNFMDTV
ncbi:MAG: ABC transporter permease [Bacteroidales bacterium]|nr:ABC transporter permease [Candidatus Cryptobacteroides faecihippi]